MSKKHLENKSPSKTRRDRERAIQHSKELAQKRRESSQLFGFVKLVGGEIISIYEAQLRLAAANADEPGKFRELSNNPHSFKAITKVDVVEWHDAESIRDELGNRGEVDAVAHYPSLGVFPGMVVRDPNMHPPYRLRYR